MKKWPRSSGYCAAIAYDADLHWSLRVAFERQLPVYGTAHRAAGGSGGAMGVDVIAAGGSGEWARADVWHRRGD